MDVIYPALPQFLTERPTRKTSTAVTGTNPHRCIHCIVNEADVLKSIEHLLRHFGINMPLRQSGSQLMPCARPHRQLPQADGSRNINRICIWNLICR
jgi:hypothetical protein